jgi:hypothetical protein
MKFERTQNKPFQLNLSLGPSTTSRVFAWFYAYAFILISLHSPLLQAGDLAYAQSPHDTSASAQDIFNLFDQKSTTAWCSATAEGTQTHHVQVALKSRQTIEHIELKLRTPPVAPLQVEISNGHHSVMFALVGQNLHIKFDKPFSGQVFDFYFENVDQQTPLCISELKMLSNGKNLVKLPAKNRLRKTNIAGTWFEGEPGTTEKKLIFSIDGTWSWVHKPFFGKQETRVSGTYVIRNDVLTLSIKGTRQTWKTTLAKDRVLIDPDAFDAPDFDYDTLLLQGSQPHFIAGSYNNARFDSMN